jgi:predicted transcriptional regulator
MATEKEKRFRRMRTLLTAMDLTLLSRLYSTGNGVPITALIYSDMSWSHAYVSVRKLDDLGLIFRRTSGRKRSELNLYLTPTGRKIALAVATIYAFCGGIR